MRTSSRAPARRLRPESRLSLRGWPAHARSSGRQALCVRVPRNPKLAPVGTGAESLRAVSALLTQTQTQHTCLGPAELHILWFGQNSVLGQRAKRHGHQATLKDERHQAQVLNQVLGPSERGALLWGTGRKPVMPAAGPVGG